VDLSASAYRSYTIQYLKTGTAYYVRVFAVNSYGLGLPGSSSPAYAQTSLQVPGRPHTITAYTYSGSSSSSLTGSIKVSWQRPRIPAHGIACSGLAASPNDCPTAVGGSLPQSDGGSSILEYLIQYNELPDFSGYDDGQVVASASTSSASSLTLYVLTNLTPGRTYYLRVLARNALGAGQFCAYAETNCNIVSTSNQVHAVASS
jgi:hypothetical protein